MLYISVIAFGIIAPTECWHVMGTHTMCIFYTCMWFKVQDFMFISRADFVIQFGRNHVWFKVYWIF